MKKRLTILSYISFIFISVMFTIPGVAMIEISKSFKAETYVIGYALTFFTVGTSLATFVSGYLLDKFDIKKILYSSYLLAALGIAVIAFSFNIYTFGAALILLGFGTGILIACSNYTLVKLYDKDERRAKLSILNFFYGFGSFICPLVASFTLKANIEWKWLYIIMVLLLGGFALTIKVSDTSMIKHEESHTDTPPAKFTSGIVFIGLSLFFYVISEVSFTTWVVTYMREYLNTDIVISGAILTCFWILMSLGRLLSSFLSEKIKLEKYILISMVISFFSILAFLFCRNIQILFVIIGIAGLSYSALYPSLLTYGTLQVDNIPPHIMTFFITMGAAGSLAAFPISSFIKQSMTLREVIIASPFLMVVAVIFIMTTFKKKKNI